MQKVRTRLVNFRVTDDEFEQLKSASDRLGARCLSDFARNVMLSGQSLDYERLTEEMTSLKRRIAILEISLSDVVDTLAGLKVGVAVSRSIR